MKKNIVTGIFALAVVAFASTAANAQINEILKLMENHKNALQSLQADIKMGKTNSQLDITDTQTGEVFYLPAKSNKVYMRIDWAKPVVEYLAVIKDKYVLYRPALKQAIEGKVEGNKNAKASNAFAFMTMSKKELSDNYEFQQLAKVQLDGIDVFHLKLTPKIKQPFKYAELWVDGDGMPRQVKVVEKNSDYTTVRLSKLKKNVKLKGDIFKLNPPPGTSIISG